MTNKLRAFNSYDQGEAARNASHDVEELLYDLDIVVSEIGKV